MHFRPSQSWFYFQSPFIITIDVKDANVEHEPQPPYNPKIPPPPQLQTSPRPSLLQKVDATLYATKHSSQNEQSFGNSTSLAKTPVIVFKWPQLFQNPPKLF